MKEFRCSCTGCGKKPEFASAGIWIETESGMLCDSCWKEAVRISGLSPGKSAEGESEFCCFCALCKRTPPDPDYKMWIGTEKGCICEKCWKEVIAGILGEKIESALLEKKPVSSEPLDVQLGCCLLNKRLLNKALDALLQGEVLKIIAENTETMKSMVEKYAGAKGCTITGITDRNGTCLISIRRT
ncbi:MAG: hypothetical protein M1508_08905 [Nitrospirae bacterium]|nr:hypothetical protein [Nitrospirota bacterium]